MLSRNAEMLRVLASAGIAVRQSLAGGVVQITMPLMPDTGYLDAVAERERNADVASLRHVLCPASVAVVGAGRRATSVGGVVLRNLVSGGFGGTVVAVNPRAGTHLAGVPCVPSVAALPEPPELAVIAVPPQAVAEVADECGRSGVRALVVITSGGDGPALLAACRRHGMRLVGPNCFGITNTAVRLDATFAAEPVRPGTAGVVVQSGGVGIGLREHLSRLGIGISSFVSAGDKYDVSANDLLLWWESDPATRLGVLHVESYGNPRKFARTARRVGRRIPLLTVVAGRSPAGQRAASSHTAAAATPEVTQEALFRQAGIIATHGLGELLDAAALLAHRPLPAGPRVAVVSNAGGAGVLAADACADAGLTAAVLGEGTVEELTRTLPRGAACAGPVDTTAAIDPERFARCLDLVADDDGVDAVLALVVPTAAADLTHAVAAGGPAKPVAAVVLDQAEAVRVRTGPGGRRVPSYGFPENAARALAHAWARRRWLDRPTGTEPRLADLRPATVARTIRSFLARTPEGGWLPPAPAMDLLGAYGLPLAGWRLAAGGVETLCGVAGDPVFGPLIVFGLGGVATDVLGHRGTPAVDVAALRDTLLRLSRLADDHPDIAEIDLNPVIARADGVVAVDARVRIVPRRRWDPYLRRLR